jgi:hypothetical protein
MNGDPRIYPKSGYVVAVLANVDPPAAADHGLLTRGFRTSSSRSAPGAIEVEELDERMPRVVGDTHLP